MSRPSWHRYFLGIAQAVAVRADCTRRQVGAVLVAPDHRILSTGYNGAPAGEPGCASAGACPRAFSDVPPGSPYGSGPGRCIAIHAERNALDYARPAMVPGATMYVTSEPCPDCRALMGERGIGRAIWQGELPHSLIIAPGWSL